MQYIFHFILSLFLTNNVFSQWTKTNGPEGGIILSFLEVDTNLFVTTALWDVSIDGQRK
jgi:hypothetical protein